MTLFDTHAHLDDELFDGVRDAVMARAEEAGVMGIVAVGITAESSATCVELADRYDAVHAAVGIQPNYAGEAKPDDWDRIVELTDRPGVVALGETGLDRHWDYTPFDVQRDYFDRHLQLARQRDLPVIVHMRDCEAEAIDMLSEAARRGPLRGVMHAFSGDAETALRCVDLGLCVSFAGNVTFKKADELRRAAAAVPDDHILIETDCPYLAPHPHRGKRPNEPAWLIHTASCLAEVRGVAVEQFARQTTDNARQLFGVGSREVRSTKDEGLRTKDER